MAADSSRPGRELGRVITTEISWRYLRSKGFSKKQLRRLLLEAERWRDDPDERQDRERT